MECEGRFADAGGMTGVVRISGSVDALDIAESRWGSGTSMIGGSSSARDGSGTGPCRPVNRVSRLRVNYGGARVMELRSSRGGISGSETRMRQMGPQQMRCSEATVIDQV